jgi:AraC family transcriptional regulator, regulatory protein of adaptative response / methylated-DNA-[protein]-cysteine methyltransferase
LTREGRYHRNMEANESTYWDAVLARDAGRDGEFFYGVRTTGVFCRPSCPARRPRRENVIFLETAQEAVRAGLRPCRRCRPLGRDASAERLTRICRFIERNLDQSPALAALAEEAGLSPFHLQRSFKAALGITPREYADACRLRTFKKELRQGRPVTQAQMEAGYGSSSRLYERTDAQLGMTPSAYRAGAPGADVRYAVGDSPLGPVLVAATGKGVCAIQFGRSADELRIWLEAEYPRADIAEDGGGMGDWLERVMRFIVGEYRELPLPLDIQATAFQRRVWDYLRKIPYGSTQSYAEVAEGIGRPTAARAVAGACGSNRIALAIPCHRVVRAGGELGGYRWGVERKRKLLKMEESAGSGGRAVELPLT